MSVNDVNTPSIVPQNEWTLMIQAMEARKRGGGPMPDAEGVPIMGTPLPAVRSADLGRATTPMVPVPPPLSYEEITELNRKALESGVHPSQIPGFSEEESMGPYASLEDAIKAGAPVGADEAQVAIGAQRFREPVPVFPPPDAGRQTAREFVAARNAANSVPHLPDFTKVQMIDMVNGKVYVDGMEFECTKPELKMLRTFCVKKAKEQVLAALEKALSALEADGDGGTEAV